MTVFSVKYACRNCGKEWDIGYDAGIEVKDSPIMGTVFIHNVNCATHPECTCHYETCPRCHLCNKIVVLLRGDA